MANLVIKPTTNNSLKIQDQGGTERISLNTSGELSLPTITSATIGSGVTFPTGHIINIESTKQSSDSAGQGSGTWISDSITIKSTSSDVLVMISGFMRKDNGSGTDTAGHARLYMTGGGFGTTTSGYLIARQIGYGEANLNSETMLGQSVLDTAPGSTTPTYGLYVDVQSSATYRYRLQIVLLEVLA